MIGIHENGELRALNNGYTLGSGGGSGTPIPTADTNAQFDSDAHMNSTDMTTGADSELENFIDGLNVGTGGGVESSTLTVVKGTVGTKNYCKKVGYIVVFYIELTGISWASGWNTLATLPTGYIPTDYFDFAGIDNTNDTACHGKVTAGGEVQVYKTSSLSNNIRLNGMFIV